jgi:hypothetical protein
VGKFPARSVDTISDTLARAFSYDLAAFSHDYTYRAVSFLKMNRRVLPGWQVEEKAQFEHEGLPYEEDLLIGKDGHEIYINAKNGSVKRGYVASDYRTTYILANSLNKEGIHPLSGPGDWHP